MAKLDKARVLDALRLRTRQSLERLIASQQATQAGATHEETQPENDKDTRAIEATYLARGLAARVESLENDAALLESFAPHDFAEADSIGVGALVGLEDEEGQLQIAFVVPCAGGEVLEVDGDSVQCLTPTSPLGQALVSRFVDDEVEVVLPGGRQTLTIVWLR